MENLKLILNVFSSPSKVYEKIKGNRLSIIFPVIILIFFFLLKDFFITYDTAKVGTTKLTIGIMGQKSSFVISPYLFLIKPIIVIPLIILIKAIFFFAFNIFLKDRLNFKKYFLVIAYSAQVRIIEALIILIYYLFFKETINVSPSIIFNASGFFYSLLSKLDFFSIWEIILIVYGINHITNIDRKKGWTIGIIIWIIYILISAYITKG